MTERVLSERLCECGCGQQTYLSVTTGEPNRFRHGHSGPPPPRRKPRFHGDGPNPSGLCMCDCGARTQLARQTRSERGEIKGKPVRYVLGHSPRTALPDDIPIRNISGLCECGCGNPAPIAKYTSRIHNRVKGRPLRFIAGHHGSQSPVPEPVVDENGCWIWQGHIRADGRTGTRKRRGAVQQAYRSFYEEHVGPVPDGYHVHHTCENPSCVNPAHLEALTPAEHAAAHRSAA